MQSLGHMSNELTQMPLAVRNETLTEKKNRFVGAREQEVKDQ